MKAESVCIPEKYRILSGSALKCIALFTMIVDHVGLHLLRNSGIVLLHTSAGSLELFTLMRKVGRLAFPIYCFLLVEGFLHTHDRRKYGLNLLAFALISEIPWNLEHTGALHCSSQNVFFTLFLGYAGMCCIEELKELNEDVIDEAKEEIELDAQKYLEAELKKALKGNKYIKIK